MISNATIKIVNTQLILSSSYGNKYYTIGILFMVFVMGLLIYVNFFNEYSISQLFFKILDSKLFCCFRIIICKCLLFYKIPSDINTDAENTNNASQSFNEISGNVCANNNNSNNIYVDGIDLENKKIQQLS